MTVVRFGKWMLLGAIAASGMMLACSANPANSSANGEAEKGDKKKKHDKDEPTPSNANTLTDNSGDCDKSLWDHVYDPTRLEVLAECKTVTGTIVERDSNEDGDEHMLLKLDPGQEDLINARNEKKKEGALVIEAVCANTVKDKKAKDACRDFSNSVYLPAVGERVRVTGSYVLDGHNGWAEIHPISKVERIE